jgi:signal transduction histidine kinase
MTETHQIKSIGEVKSAVKGDRDRIGQVLINLLTNAIKYSPQGKVVIIRSSVNKGFVTVSVQDFGIGIPKSKQKNIFDKYFQIDGRSEVGKHGFGLGLYITSEIIKRHGGEIGVESDKGKGSTFYFTLPIKG